MNPATRSEHNHYRVRPYQTYEPSQSTSPQVLLLEKKVNELMQKLRVEESRLFRINSTEIEQIKDDLDFMIAQRDELIDKEGVLQLEKNLNAEHKKGANEIEKAKSRRENYISGAVIGMSATSETAFQIGLPPDLTIASMAVGAVAGALFKDYISNRKHHSQSKSDI